jgi:hypothetical protein
VGILAPDEISLAGQTRPKPAAYQIPRAKVFKIFAHSLLIHPKEPLHKTFIGL